MNKKGILILLIFSALLVCGCESECRIYSLNGKGRSLGKLGESLFVCGPMDCQVVKIDLRTAKQDCIVSYMQDTHGLRVYNDYIWVTDIKNHQIYKIDKNGRLVWSFGEKGVPGCDKMHLNKPTDIAVDSNGNIYIADGYGNSRVICIDSEGKYLFDWGVLGDKPGQFNHPHNIIIADNKVYVADRDNNRIQVFTADGRFIAEHRQSGKVFGLDAYENKLYISIVSDTNNSILVTDLSCNKIAEFGQTGSDMMQFKTPHGLAVDRDNIYIADMENQRVQIVNRNYRKDFKW
jgi:peptidylamidoglycolate lyase